MRLTACLAMCEPVVMWISKNLRPHAARTGLDDPFANDSL